MISLALCLYFSWLLLLRGSSEATGGTGDKCDGPQFKTNAKQCRLFTLCVEPKEKGDPLKEYLFACPFGANFNLFLYSCYDFQQECAVEEGPELDKKLYGALLLKLPKKRQSCNGATAPFCSSENDLTVCHPWSRSVMGFVDCKNQSHGEMRCDKKKATCVLDTSSSVSTSTSTTTRRPTSTDEDLQKTVVLCSAFLETDIQQRCFDIFGKEFVCSSKEENCPLYVGEVLSLSATDIPKLRVNVQVQTYDANATVETIVKSEKKQNTTKNKHDGEILNPKIKLHVCQNSGGNCLSDKDTFLICSDSLRVKHVYRCSLVYGNSSECLAETNECISYQDSFITKGSRKSATKSPK